MNYRTVPPHHRQGFRRRVRHGARQCEARQGRRTGVDRRVRRGRFVLRDHEAVLTHSALLVLQRSRRGVAGAAPPAAPTLVPLDIFTVPDGLEVTLWAQSPQLKNPTNMDIDAQGRIWVTEGVNYRRHKERDPKGDRVVVLEDTDRRRPRRQATTFVQEPTLVAPLGIAVIDNKIIVSNAPDLIVYTDVDRDAKFDPRVDKREVLLTGFDGRNHDHALHSVTFGPDGRWYFSQGNAGAHLHRSRRQDVPRRQRLQPGAGRRRAAGVRLPPPSYAGAKSDDGHVYVGGFSARMQPDGTGVEILGFNFRNSYEQTVTSFGDIFHNDNDDPPACRTTFLMEYGNLGFFSRDGKRYWNADRRPGQSIPTAEWRQEDPGRDSVGRCLWRRRAHRHRLQRRRRARREMARPAAVAPRPRATRSSAISRSRTARATSWSVSISSPATRSRQFAGTDFKGGKVNSEIQTFFRPSDVAVGPDGAIYVADWFDPRVGGHDDKDDTTSGAIYRIAPKGFRAARAEDRRGDRRRPDRGAAESRRSTCARCGFTELAARGAAAHPGRRGTARRREPVHPRTRRVAAGATGSRAVSTASKRCSDDAGPDDARSSLIARCGRWAARCASRGAAGARSFSRRAPRSGAVTARRAVRAARDLLLTLAKGYDGKDRSYLEAWGIGATGKEEALYTALAARNRARRREVAASYADLVWRLTPRAAVPAFAARAQSPLRCPWPNAPRRSPRSASSRRPRRPTALLDVAQHGGTDIKQNPALWWLHQLQGFALGGRGHRRRAQAPRALRSGHGDDQRSHGAGAAGEIRAARRRRHRQTAWRCEARRDRRRRLPHVPSRQGRRASTTRRRSTASRAGRRATS